MQNKIVWLKALLHIAIGVLGPISALTVKPTVKAEVAAGIGGCVALLAFLSTAFAESNPSLKLKRMTARKKKSTKRRA